MSLGEEIASLGSGSTNIQHSGSKCMWYAYALESQKEEKGSCMVLTSDSHLYTNPQHPPIILGSILHTSLPFHPWRKAELLASI